MQSPWKKLENDHGYPFYINENTKQKQWDHPKFTNVRQMIDDCNYVKYSKYRIALKFRNLQKALLMEEVSLGTVVGVFSRHQLNMNESSFCLESYDVEAILYDIYFAANKQNHRNMDIDFAVELMQNFLYSIYDKERQVKIQVSSMKLVLVLLSNSELPELFHVLFTLCADHNHCVTRLRLQALVSKFVQIAIFMHEDVSFGQHLITSMVENCFSKSPGLVGISESNFVNWLSENQQLFCWIPILHRIRSCESVVHNVKCSACKTSPLKGLMYRCMKCSKYTQCQRCFFTGQINNSHKLSHSMREYSTEEDISREFTSSFIKKLCALVACPVKLLSTDVEVVGNKQKRESFFPKSTTTDTLISNTESLASPEKQLHLIIKKLELQNSELQRILLLGTHSKKEITQHLQDHKDEIGVQIHKLKLLKDYLQTRFAPKNTLQSTPMVGGVKYPKRSDLENMLSPIVHLPECKESDRSDEETICTSNNEDDVMQDSMPYSLNDVSTWIKNHQTPCSTNESETSLRKSPVRKLHNDLDDALAKLQQILANNLTLDESLDNIDNNHLKHAVSEVEGMLTSFIDNVESSRASSVQPLK